MTKTLYDPSVEERARNEGIVQVAKNMLIHNADITLILATTNLELSDIERLRKELEQ